jgi:hypothetical protein
MGRVVERADGKIYVGAAECYLIPCPFPSPPLSHPSDLVDDSICSLSDLLQLLIFLHGSAERRGEERSGGDERSAESGDVFCAQATGMNEAEYVSGG